MTIDLSQTLEYLQNLELKNVGLKLNEVTQQIIITDTSIFDERASQERFYALEARDDQFVLRFRAPFDYRDYFSQKDADLIKSNKFEFDIYKNQINLSANDLQLEDLAKMIEFAVDYLGSYGDIIGGLWV